MRPGVVGWLKTLSRELAADGITVNTIAPGKIDTDRLRSVYGADGPSATDLAAIPAGRLGTPAEIAAIACFLASERAVVRHRHRRAGRRRPRCGPSSRRP